MVKADAVDPEARQARGQLVRGVVVGETTPEGEIAGQESDTLAAAIDEMSAPRTHEAMAASGPVIEPGDVHDRASRGRGQSGDDERKTLFRRGRLRQERRGGKSDQTREQIADLHYVVRNEAVFAGLRGAPQDVEIQDLRAELIKLDCSISLRVFTGWSGGRNGCPLPTAG